MVFFVFRPVVVFSYAIAGQTAQRPRLDESAVASPSATISSTCAAVAVDSVVVVVNIVGVDVPCGRTAAARRTAARRRRGFELCAVVRKSADVALPREQLRGGVIERGGRPPAEGVASIARDATLDRAYVHFNRTRSSQETSKI